MTETELHWLAGWLEGEGCFGADHRVTRPNYRHFRISGTTTDRDVALKVNKLLNGHIHTAPGTNKLRYNITQSRTSEVISLMQQLLPLMCERRAARIRQILDVIANYKPLTRLECTNRARASRAEKTISANRARALEIKTLRDAGLTWVQIQARIGTSDSNAQRILQKYGRNIA